MLVFKYIYIYTHKIAMVLRFMFPHWMQLVKPAFEAVWKKCVQWENASFFFVVEFRAHQDFEALTDGSWIFEQQMHSSMQR